MISFEVNLVCDGHLSPCWSHDPTHEQCHGIIVSEVQDIPTVMPVIKIARNKGWKVSMTGRKALCPACLKSRATKEKTK
jgi:hypothetical protein